MAAKKKHKFLKDAAIKPALIKLELYLESIVPEFRQCSDEAKEKWFSEDEALQKLKSMRRLINEFIG